MAIMIMTNIVKNSFNSEHYFNFNSLIGANNNFNDLMSTGDIEDIQISRLSLDSNEYYEYYDETPKPAVEVTFDCKVGGKTYDNCSFIVSLYNYLEIMNKYMI